MSRRFSQLLLVTVALTFGCESPQGAMTADTETAPVPSVGARPSERNAPSQREVEFPAEGLTLKGSLELPATSPSSAPSPAVVLIHGSGPHSRDQAAPGQLNMQFGFEIPVFQQLAARLRNKGFAVLRYDKRTCGPFNGCADNGYATPTAALTMDTLAQDAAAAVSFLAKQPEVDATRVFVVGHSQGARLALEVLATERKARAAVLLAGSYRPLDQLLQYQLDFTTEQLRGAGLATDTVERALEPLQNLRKQAQAARRGEGGENAAFLKSWIEMDERGNELVAGLDRPVLALAGDYDWNVPPEELEAWKASFAGAQNNPGHQSALLPCITHALNCINERDPAKLTPQALGREVDETVHQHIADFLQKF